MFVGRPTRSISRRRPAARLQTSERKRLSSCLRAWLMRPEPETLLVRLAGRLSSFTSPEPEILTSAVSLGAASTLPLPEMSTLSCFIARSPSLGLAGSGDLDRRLIDAALGADRAAATDAKVEVGLADILHHELARSGNADVTEGAARQRDLQIAPGRPSVAVEHQATASHLDIGDEVGRSASRRCRCPGRHGRYTVPGRESSMASPLSHAR